MKAVLEGLLFISGDEGMSLEDITISEDFTALTADLALPCLHTKLPPLTMTTRV